MKKVLSLMAVFLFLAFPIHATVSDTESPVKVYTSGSTTSYPIPFDYIDDEDIVVTLYVPATAVSIAQTIDVDYTIVSNTVIYSTAPGDAYEVVIRRVTPYTQEASWVSGSAPPLSAWESAFDKLTFLTQDLNERLARALLLPEGSSGLTLPDPAYNAGKVLRFNAAGTEIEAGDIGGSGLTINMAKFSDYATVAAMISTIGSTEKTVIGDSVLSLTANTVFPSTLHVVMQKGGSIAQTGAYTLTINGSFDAPVFQVFSGFSPHQITFAAGAVDAARPEWWGDPSSAGPLAYAYASLPTTGGRIHMVTGTTYAISTAITVLKDNVWFDLEDGAIIQKQGTGNAIEVARASSTTVTGFKITGGTITARDAGATAGIVLAPDATNEADYVTIQDVIIDGMGQYGIVQSGGAGITKHLTLKNVKILNNGTTASTNFTEIALVLYANTSSEYLTIDNVYAEQTGTSSTETDGCKIQGFTHAKISNFTVKGGNQAVLAFNNNTDLLASNLDIVVDGGSSGLQVDTSATGGNIINGVNVSGTFGVGSDYAIFLATSGSKNLTITNLKTPFSTSGAGTHDGLEITDSTFGTGGLRFEDCTITNGVFKNNTFATLTYVTGDNNYFENNLSLNSTGTAYRVAGDNNVFKSNTAISPASYGFDIAGDANVMISNIVTGSHDGPWIIRAGGTGNIVTDNYGDTGGTDDGTLSVGIKSALGPKGNFILTGRGSPESSIVAHIGSIYLDFNGSTGTTLYIKESGTGNTGWVAK